MKVWPIIEQKGLWKKVSGPKLNPSEPEDAGQRALSLCGRDHGIQRRLPLLFKFPQNTKWVSGQGLASLKNYTFSLPFARRVVRFWNRLEVPRQESEGGDEVGNSL